MSGSGDGNRVRVSLQEVEVLAYRALRGSGTAEATARVVARSVWAAERDEIPSHGMMRVPTYCEHAACGKVDGHARPTLERPAAGVLWVDARTGFAHPAIELGFGALVPAARENGIASLAIGNSYNCGVLGHHVERLAEQGLIGFGCANTPAAIAPWGGSRALFGTNPLAFAVPRGAGEALVIDQSSSVVARGEVMLRAQQGEEVPAGWALDARGEPTRDAKAALAGSMLPFGGYKGAAIALMVEVLAAALTGANFSFAAASFANSEGGPPRTGQWFMAIDPATLGPAFGERMETLVEAIAKQPGTRLPGARRSAARARTEAEGVVLSSALLAAVTARAEAFGS